MKTPDQIRERINDLNIQVVKARTTHEADVFIAEIKALRWVLEKEEG